MKIKKTKLERPKPLSVYPLKWWEAMAAFLQIPPDKAKEIREKTKA